MCEDRPPLKHVNQQARGAEIVMGLAENPSAIHTQKHSGLSVHTNTYTHSNIYLETDTLQAQRASKYTETVRQTHKEGFFGGLTDV